MLGSGSENEVLEGENVILGGAGEEEAGPGAAWQKGCLP